MIPRSQQYWQGGSWQQQLSSAINDSSELLEVLGLPAESNAGADQQFRLKVPRGFVELMEYGNRQDPLLLQVLPVAEETSPQPGYTSDPLEEARFLVAPGLIQKYQGRALMMVSPVCAVHCRYCFRRHFPYDDAQPSQDEWQQALDWLGQRPDIHEIIFSGGDPLAVSDNYFRRLLNAVEAIPHIRRLRIHSRLPVVLPPRISDEWLDIFAGTRLQRVMVLHCNHPGELSPELAAAVQKLTHAGFTVLNQAVLLNNVNTDSDTLARLSENLFGIGVLPYYLHTLDAVEGAAHFAISDDKALQIHRQLQARLPGFLVPKLVREVPGKAGKSPLIEIVENTQ